MLGNARQLKNQVVGLAMDAEGLLPDALEAACRTRRAKLLYLTPTLQNPTTATMSLARREAIVAIARRHDLLIIEDDVNGLLPQQPVTPLVNLAPERVIYLGSLAKIACGGLRVGFVLTPPALRGAFAQAMRLSSWMVSPLLIELACKLVSQRQIMPLVEQQRQILARRGELLRHLLPGACWQAGSMHAWLPLPEPWRSQEFAEAANALDVGVASGEHFAAGQFAAPQGVRLSLASRPPTPASPRGWSGSPVCCAPRRPPIPCYSQPRPSPSVRSKESPCTRPAPPCCSSLLLGLRRARPSAAGAALSGLEGELQRLEEELAAMNGLHYQKAIDAPLSLRRRLSAPVPTAEGLLPSRSTLTDGPCCATTTGCRYRHGQPAPRRALSALRIRAAPPGPPRPARPALAGGGGLGEQLIQQRDCPFSAKGPGLQ